jgi:signal transduction histidine kinase
MSVTIAGSNAHPAPRDSSPPPGSSLAKDAEQRGEAMHRELRQMHRLTVLGTAAATIAHEFNNLMTPVVSYTKYALDTGDTELMKKALSITLRQAAIVTNMSDRILGLAANEPHSVRRTEVREVIEDAVACLCRDLGKDGITLNTRVDGDLAILVDSHQIRQVLFNLLINARQAIGRGAGRITIEASARANDTVSITIRDTGCGIPAENLKSIFEPFVTTKNGQGNDGRSGVGLGLAVCRDIIEENRGTILVESEVGTGTSFHITLPAAV